MAHDPKSNSMHYPPDRRMCVRVRPIFFVAFAAVAVLPLLVAWVQFLAFGLPTVQLSPSLEAPPPPDPFPGWLRLAHFVNFMFMVLLVRSGIGILMDHPRLYWNSHCTPGTAWIQFTPIDVPTDRLWTAKDDARYISPWLALPGYRHAIGPGRHWHLLSALAWLLNGIVFVVLLFSTNEWAKLVPRDVSILADAWAVQVHYATFHMPPEPDPAVGYNALQQLAYFGVIFGMAPLSMLTGLAMSPAVDNRFRWYPKLFGGRQAARSIHFLLLLGYLGFLCVHVTMVMLTDPVRNLNYISRGHNDGSMLGVILTLLALGSVIGLCFLAHWISWNKARSLQYFVRHIHGGFRRAIFKRIQPRAQYTKSDISPYFWANGKLPTTEEWLKLEAGGFADYRLRVYGLVDNPVELSMAELLALGKQEQITMHHCIQGWSGIAEWGGLSLAQLLKLVKPLPEAGAVVFHSFGEGLYGGEYYDTQPIDIAMNEQSLLAYEMNFAPLTSKHGAPLRLRIESQLGYKMVKWIKSIEIVASVKTVGKGHGGTNEDDEFYDLVPEI